MEYLKEILCNVAPLIAGFLTSIIIPTITNKITVKFLKNKINEVSEAKILTDLKKEVINLNKEIKDLKQEILEMRGKVK